LKTFWGELAQRLRVAVLQAGGPSASYSGGLKVVFTSYGEVYVEVGGQDIDDWRRKEPVGTFETEAEAGAATLRKVEEAETIASKPRGNA
jgi:hypothetical protein